MMLFETSPAQVQNKPMRHPGPEAPSGAWLLLAEMNHRVANEYALAISSISQAARRAAPEAQTDLIAARDRLYSYAEAHRALLAPLGERTDLSEYLAHLCFKVGLARLAERGVALRFIADPFEMPSEVCWRVGLIVSELITNALRHGVGRAGGLITVELRVSAEGVDCAVRDNGGPTTFSPPGRGAQIIDGIAKELGGRINRSFGRTGCCVVLSIGAAAAA